MISDWEMSVVKISRTTKCLSLTLSADNPLHNAPHTLDEIMDPEWSRAYSRELAVFPTEEVRANKSWPTVNRIDGRNLHCSFVAIDEYIEE